MVSFLLLNVFLLFAKSFGCTVNCTAECAAYSNCAASTIDPRCTTVEALNCSSCWNCGAQTCFLNETNCIQLDFFGANANCLDGNGTNNGEYTAYVRGSDVCYADKSTYTDSGYAVKYECADDVFKGVIGCDNPTYCTATCTGTKPIQRGKCIQAWWLTNVTIYVSVSPQDACTLYPTSDPSIYPTEQPTVNFTGNDIAQTFTLSQLDSFPGNASFGAAGWYNNTLIVASLSNSNQAYLTYLNGVWNPKTVASNAPTGLNKASQNYFQSGSKLYIIGTDDNENRNQMYIYDMMTNTNTLWTPLLGNVGNNVPILYGCVTYDAKRNHIWYIGGFQNIYAVGSMQYYNFTADEWTQKGTLDTGRYKAGCAVDCKGSNIYIFGGIDHSGNSIADIERFTIAFDGYPEAKMIGALTEARSELKCVLMTAFNGYIYCLGGVITSNSNEVISDKVDVFDPKTESIYASFSMQQPRRTFLYAVVGGNCLYVLDGNSGSMEYLGYCPTLSPTVNPTIAPSVQPTSDPTFGPTIFPTKNPTNNPIDTLNPSINPTIMPTILMSADPTLVPTNVPSNGPSLLPSESPSFRPTFEPIVVPSRTPTMEPTAQIATQLGTKMTEGFDTDSAEWAAKILPFVMSILAFIFVY